VVYSFGIGEDASWDLGLICAKGCVIHGFDPTPKSLKWVENHVNEPRFVMYPHALADFDGSLDLWLPANPDHVSASIRQSSGTSDEKITVPCEKLSSIIKRLGHERVDVLKMDIEGAEYAVLKNLCSEEGLLARIDVLLVEFHHWMPAFSNNDTREAIRLLRNGGFVPGWVSEAGHELMFIRK
jgi:FkbM family methyltransferase